MKNAHHQLKNKALKQAKVKQHYDALESEFDLLHTLIKARHAAKKSQADVADLMGTTTSVIGRLESGGGKSKHSPTINTLQRYAKAIDKRLVIKLVPNK